MQKCFDVVIKLERKPILSIDILTFASKSWRSSICTNEGSKSCSTRNANIIERHFNKNKTTDVQTL